MFTIALQESYDVLTAKSGEECIKLYLDAKRSGRKIDLILLDYRLGDTTGYDVAHKIKELNDVKIIMITAFHVDHDITRELKMMSNVNVQELYTASKLQLSPTLF
jgi:CheY-like chemotaxis protein